MPETTNKRPLEDLVTTSESPIKLVPFEVKGDTFTWRDELREIHHQWEQGDRKTRLSNLLETTRQTLGARISMYSLQGKSFSIICNNGSTGYTHVPRTDASIMNSMVGLDKGVYAAEWSDGQQYLGMHVIEENRRQDDVERPNSLVINVCPRRDKVFDHDELTFLRYMVLPKIAEDIQRVRQLALLKFGEGGSLLRRDDYESRLNDFLDQSSDAEGVLQGTLDLRGFGEFNHRIGHFRGDEVLQLVSERIQKEFRTEDLVAIKKYRFTVEEGELQLNHRMGASHKKGDEWFFTYRGNLAQGVIVLKRVFDAVYSIDVKAFLDHCGQVDQTFNANQAYDQIRADCPTLVDGQEVYHLVLNTGVHAWPVRNPGESADAFINSVVGYAGKAMEVSKEAHKASAELAIGYTILVPDPRTPGKSRPLQGKVSLEEVPELANLVTHGKQDEIYQFLLRRTGVTTQATDYRLTGRIPRTLFQRVVADAHREASSGN